MNDVPRWNAVGQSSARTSLVGCQLGQACEQHRREQQQAAGEDDRHHAGLIDPQRQVLLAAAIDAAAADVLGALRGNAPLALRDEHHAARPRRRTGRPARSAFRRRAGRRLPPSSGTDLLESASARRRGMPARMPAMISKLMPLPMPYSSICSPSHIRKIVPAVIVSTATRCQVKRQLSVDRGTQPVISPCPDAGTGSR